jgi:hypothetical protein
LEINVKRLLPSYDVGPYIMVVVVAAAAVVVIAIVTERLLYYLVRRRITMLYSMFGI